MADTKEQILDSAEALFAEHGIEGVSLRRIITEAGVNSAAIHYHFGSKEGLVKDVFSRRFEPLNRERLALLSEAEARAGDGPLLIEDILYAVVAPALRMGQGSEAGQRFRRLAGRLFTGRPGYLEVVFTEVFRELEQRFDESCRRALPDVPKKERAWRKHLAIGAMAHVLRESEWICKTTGGLCDTAEVEGGIQRMVQFMAAGMKAPVLESLAEEVLTPERRGNET